MNLALLKELEDLKKKQGTLSARLAKKIETKIEHSITEAFHDFDRFFKENGFEVQSGERIVSASYGNLKATLTYDIPEAPYLNCYFAFDLILQFQENTEYQLLLISKHQNRTTESFDATEGPAQQIRQSIQEVTASIEKTEESIKNFSKEIWSFELRSKKQKKKANRNIYDSVYELLTTTLTKEHE